MDKKSTELVQAAQLGNTKQLTSLLESGVDPNVRDTQGWSPLHWAAQEGHTKAVDLLIRAGAIVDLADNEGFSPLMLAVGEGYADLVRLLIAHGANVNQRCKAHKNGTPLHLACAWNRFEVAKKLISSGAEINAVDLADRTPLFFAVMYSNEKILKFLINQGATIDLKKKDSEEHKTILDLAVAADNSSIIDLLKSAQRHPCGTDGNQKED